SDSIAPVRRISIQSTVALNPGRKRGATITPKVSAFAFSLWRSGLRDTVPRAVKSTIFDWKFAGTPAAAQLACRVAGFGPPLMNRASHGSSAVVKIWLDGLNNSVTAGARTERV